MIKCKGVHKKSFKKEGENALKKAISFIFLIIISAVVFSLSSLAADENSVAIKVATESTALNIRSGKSTSSSVLKTAKKGTYLTLIEKQGTWYKVEYQKDKFGYCHSDYVKDIDASFPARVKISSGVLNVRRGKGTSYEIKDTLKNGTNIVVLNSKSEWYRILYNGNTTGYVHSKYLTTSFGSNYKKIALSVPSYKQTDTRWSSYPIGTQGDTIGTIGCTTTCLAMTESYRKGYTVTPKDMAKSLSYSPSGSLYWPQSYSTELLSESTYLKRIYALLQSGKPLVFGAKKSNGSQHWVVVTGHTATTDTLSPYNFSINDPGSKTRTKLNEFLSAYPKPYKIAYSK